MFARSEWEQPGSTINCCLQHWRGSALGFPFGEAGTQIGTSEPIWVTEEVWYRVNIRFAVGKNQRFGVFPYIPVCLSSCRCENLFRPSVRTGAPSPKGKARRCAQQYCKQQFSVPLFSTNRSIISIPHFLPDGKGVFAGTGQRFEEAQLPIPSASGLTFLRCHGMIKSMIQEDLPCICLSIFW